MNFVLSKTVYRAGLCNYHKHIQIIDNETFLMAMVRTKNKDNNNLYYHLYLFPKVISKSAKMSLTTNIICTYTKHNIFKWIIK